MSAKRDRNAWRSLPMPSSEALVDADTWLGKRPMATVPGYFVDGDAGDYGEEYCLDHAKSLADERKANGEEDVRIVYWSGPEDGSRWCAYMVNGERCGKRLAVRLTSYGVDSELGITESDPLEVGTDAEGLRACSEAMSYADPRRALWMWHFERLYWSARLKPIACWLAGARS